MRGGVRLGAARRIVTSSQVQRIEIDFILFFFRVLMVKTRIGGATGIYDETENIGYGR